MDEMTDFRAEEREAQQAEQQQLRDPELQAKIDAENNALGAVAYARQMYGNGLGISGLYPAQQHYDPAAAVRNQAFSAAMQVHAHRTTNHHEILECARAFEDYLKGHPEYAEATLAA